MLKTNYNIYSLHETDNFLDTLNEDELFLYKAFLGEDLYYYTTVWNPSTPWYKRYVNKEVLTFLPLGPIWLGRRKLYTLFLIVIAFLFLMNAACYLIVDTIYERGGGSFYHPAKIAILLILCFVLLLFGNKIYYKKAKWAVERAKKQYKNQSSQVQYLKEVGGDSGIGQFFALIVLLLTIFLSESLFPLVKDPIAYIHSERYENSPYTIQTDFMQYFYHDEWKYVKENNKDYVVFTGTDWLRDSAKVEITFLLGNNKWEIDSVKLGTKELRGMEQKEYLDYVVNFDNK